MDKIYFKVCQEFILQSCNYNNKGFKTWGNNLKFSEVFIGGLG